jgi:hypothetical protein
MLPQPVTQWSRLGIPDRFMEHIAMGEGKGDGCEETTWNEPVTEEQYNRARSR